MSSGGFWTEICSLNQSLVLILKGHREIPYFDSFCSVRIKLGEIVRKNF